MLTQEQYDHFQAFGFIVLREVFSSDERAIIDEEFERGLDAAHADKPFGGTEHQGAILTGPETPFFAKIPENPRLYEVAEQLYGEDCFPITSDANRYVGDTKWHPDHYIDVKKDTYGVKFAHYLDPVEAETGALRVIPGSHRDPLYTDLWEKIKAPDVDVRGIPSHVCPSGPGDIVAFDLRLWHASCGGATGRRMCTVCFYKHAETPDEELGLRWRAGHCVQALAPKPFVNPHWASNPEGSEKRRQWLEQLEKWGFMEEPSSSTEDEETPTEED